MLNTLRSDPATSEEEHLKLMLVETEMERVKYVVRSYVRTRLSKVGLVPIPVSYAPVLRQSNLIIQIEKFSHYIVLNPKTHRLLSGSELNHARR